MANYANIKDTINQNIKTNGNQQITGQVLQNVLNAIVDNLTAGYLMVGIATEDGNPGTPDQNLCWLATQGTYTNYGNITVESGKLAVIKYNGTWTSDTVDVQGAVTAGDGIAISDEGAVSVRTGTGVKIDEEGNVAADLVAGDYISIEGNKISCTLDANPFYFVDALPDSPVPGTENKVYVVPASDSPAINLYIWNAETSQFDLVGTIDLGIDTSNFVKKGTNDITEPLELVTEEGIGSTGEMLYLRNKNGVRIGIILKFGDDTNILRSSGLQAVKDRDGNPSIALKCVLSSLKLSQDGKLQLSANNFMEGMPIRPTFYIEAPAGESWDKPNTFSISGIYSKLKTVLALNASVVLTFASRDINIETDLQYYPTDGDIQLTYMFSNLRYAMKIESDDSVTIVSKADVRKFNAADYGISLWYNASGTDQTLYKNLRKLINGDSNNDGILGYLCDSHNVFVITGINTTTSGSITTLTVSFTEANSRRQNTLIIDSTGVFSVMRWPKLEVLWADNYNLIASGMPRPDAWLVADGTDVSFYKVVAEAYKNGYNLILKEYSYGSSSCNQYTVKNIIPGGTGYSLFYESGGRQYMLTINANGSMSTVCNVFNASDYGLSSWAQSASGTNIALTQKLIACFNYNWPIIFKTATNAYPATTLFKNSTLMRFLYDDGSLGSAGSNSVRGTASLTINVSTGEYSIAVQ